MAETANEGSGVGQSVEESSNGLHSQSGEVLSEWRTSGQVETGTPSTSPSYWDTDEDDDIGLRPSQLYGKYRWKITKFSEIKSREIRSSPFDAGGYKWYILIYPKGCDVCNHLSLFLSVANHDKLRPGWSQFAQFTISVANKDSKKSKYSDTLHRFCKKEQDWGWKKFMELPKLHEGFIDDSDSLTIDAQVQVIRDRVDRPFRCLDCAYRRELVSAYLSNIEQFCRKFVEDRRTKLRRLIEDKARWTSYRVFWLGMDQNTRHQMSKEKMDVILKGVVKQIFDGTDVQSTLVMDSLYSGLKALEGRTKNKKARPRLLDAKELPPPIVSVDQDMFVLVDDVLLLLERAALEPLPTKDVKGPQHRAKDGNDGKEVNKEVYERYERHLTEWGRRTLEIFVLAHIFSSKIEVAYQEAIALKMQEELIREEEESWLAESKQRAKRGAAEREKKSKKKQAKQKRNKNKEKNKRKEEKVSFSTHEKDLEENQNYYEEKDSITEKVQYSTEKPDTLGDVSDISDSVDGSADLLQPDLEDRDNSPVHWDTDALEINPPSSGGNSRGRSISISTPNGFSERKIMSTVDDSSSTCSTDSIRSGVTNGSYQGNALNSRNQKSPNKGMNQQIKVTSNGHNLASQTEDQSSTLGTDLKTETYSSEASNVGESDWVVVSHIQEQKSSRNYSPVRKERSMAQTIANSVNMDRPKQKRATVLSSPRSVANNPLPLTQTKPEKKNMSTADATPNRRVVSATGPPSSSQLGSSAPKQAATTTMSRPSSAPIIPAMQPALVTVSSSVQPTTSLPRSVSSAGRTGPDPSLQNKQPFIPQSYKQAIVGNSLGSSSSSNHPLNSHGVVPTTLPSLSYSQTSTSYQSSIPYSQNQLLWTGRRPDSLHSPAVTSNRSTNHFDLQIAQQQAQSLMTDDFPHLDIINDLLEDEQCSNMMINGSISNPQPQVFNTQYSTYRSRSFGEEGFHNMPCVSARGPYLDGLIPTQWQMANMGLSLVSMRNSNSLEDAANYHHAYFGLDPSNQYGVNGYTEFRPSNGY